MTVVPFNGFQLATKKVSLDNILVRLPSLASTQYYPNDALFLPSTGVAGAGFLTQVTATSKATHVYVSMFTPPALLRPGTPNLSTANCEPIHAAPCAGNGLVFLSYLIGNSLPTKNGLPASANTLASTVVFADSGSSGDLLGGQIYITTLQQQSTIITDVVASGVRTVTVSPAFTRAVTTGDSIIAVPWSAGFEGVKFNATLPSQGIDTSVAGKTGGNINIEGVVLGPSLSFIDSPPLYAGTNFGSNIPYVLVSFPPA